ncbi:MAG: glycosyltransferase family 2 protein [Planctomycetota bacterium]
MPEFCFHPDPTDAEAASPAETPNAALPVSVVILTLNEADNLPGVLDSCAWCDDIAVLDSGSTDGTAEIAEARGVKVYHHAFESFGKQRNWAIENIPLKHDWVFHLDADEHFTEALVDEVGRRIAQAPDEVAGFHVPHKLMLHDRWLRRAGGYPVYQMRLFHKKRMRFIDHGHGQREAPDTVTEKLVEPYLHFAFSKGLEPWLAKHNRYARLEAQEMVSGGGLEFRWGDLFSGQAIQRRRAIKALAYRMPFRPKLRWWMVVLLQRGLLDGRSGLTYATMMSTYEQMIDLHLRDLRAPAPGTAAGKTAGTP